jgi:hypothetical protein
MRFACIALELAKFCIPRDSFFVGEQIMMNRRLTVFFASVFLLAASSGQANAGIMLDIVSTDYKTDGRDFSLGYAFRVNSNITIDGLGVWDEGSDGLSPSVEVGLWTDSGTLLRSTFVTSLSDPIASTESSGRWLFEDVPSLSLSAGNEYVVGYYRPGNSDRWLFATSPSTIPEVTYLRGLELQTSSLVLPTNSFGTNRHFGPNVRVQEGGVVPEPTSLAIFGIGALGFAAAGGARRRRKTA